MTTTEKEALNFINEALPNGGMPIQKHTTLTKLPAFTAHQLINMLAEFRERPIKDLTDGMLYDKAYITKKLTEIVPAKAHQEIGEQLCWVRDQFKNK
jgi:hypothetical protein